MEVGKCEKSRFGVSLVFLMKGSEQKNSAKDSFLYQLRIYVTGPAGMRIYN